MYGVCPASFGGTQDAIRIFIFKFVLTVVKQYQAIARKCLPAPIPLKYEEAVHKEVYKVYNHI